MCEKTGGETSDMVLRIRGVGRFPVLKSLFAVEIEPGADLGARSEPGAPAQDLGARSEPGT
ncbi:BZ3501_MvSof-1269-A2-R1_C36g00154 [Microbotryum saponariae]|nr:BZ3501_MvSof-1269-A2-R1_C36g00154 [Microbotryum saponariae]